MTGAAAFKDAAIIALPLIAYGVLFLSPGWRSYFSRRRLLFKLVVSLLAVGTSALWTVYWLLPEPVVRAELKANAEFVRIEVVNPEVSGIRIGRMRAVPDDEDTGSCISGLVLPERGAEVSYLRVGKGRLYISLAPKADAAPSGPAVRSAILRQQDGSRLSLNGPYRFVEDESCSGQPVERLTVNGVAEFGRELRGADLNREPAAGYLFDGEINIFVHSVERIAMLRLPPRIHKVENMSVPTGSRVGARPAVDGTPSVWWGLANIDREVRGLAIEAVTYAPGVSMTVPASDGASIRIDFGLYSRVSDDPNLLWFFGIVSFLLTGLALPLAAKPLEGLLRGFASPVEERGTRVAFWRRKRNRDAGIVAVAALVMMGSPLAFRRAAAEPVRLTVGDDRVGQGWMFADARDVCRIVTAAHVVSTGTRTLRPRVTSRGGQEIVVGLPMQPDPMVDIAVMEATPAGPCAAGGLQENTVERRLAASAQAFLEVIERTNQGTLPLLRRGQRIDEDGGRVLVFDLPDGVTNDVGGRPLAVLTDVEPTTRRAKAVRIDAVAAMLGRVGRGTATPNGIQGWTVRYGRSLDPAAGPEQMLPRGAGWRVQPEQGFVTLDIRFAEPRRLGVVAFKRDGEARQSLADVQISGTDDPADPPASWPIIGSCAWVPGSGDITCPFMPRRVALLRLSFRIAGATTFSDLYFAER
jgi:hypothetical protein